VANNPPHPHTPPHGHTDAPQPRTKVRPRSGNQRTLLYGETTGRPRLAPLPTHTSHPHTPRNPGPAPCGTAATGDHRRRGSLRTRRSSAIHV